MQETPASPWFHVQTQAGAATLRLAGDWRLAQLAEIETALSGLALPPGTTVDGSALTRIDSAAAQVLLVRALIRCAGMSPPRPRRRGRRHALRWRSWAARRWHWAACCSGT